jgi:pimeloyl-ACP methyl ester carboxylesterase
MAESQRKLMAGLRYTHDPMQHLNFPKSSVDVQGISIPYLEKGNGPPMLLLHGPGTSSATWRHNIHFLSKYFSLYVLDLPFFRNNQLLHSSRLTLDHCAETVFCLMAALNIDRAHLVGISLGGVIAALFSSRYPEKVHRLVLINAVGLREEGCLVQAFGGLHESLELERQILCRRSVLMISGELSRLIQLDAVHSVADRNALAKCVIIRDAGALPHKEKPEAVNQHIVSFCVEILASTLCG